MRRIRVGYWGKKWGVWWGCDANRQDFLRTSLESFLLGTWRCLLSADHRKGKGQSDRDTQPWMSRHFGSLWVSHSMSIFGGSQVYVMQWDRQCLERGYLGLFDFLREATRLSLTWVILSARAFSQILIVPEVWSCCRSVEKGQNVCELQNNGNEDEHKERWGARNMPAQWGKSSYGVNKVPTENKENEGE